ncbi:DUF2867 domain-containing protein [Rhizobium sp. AB2/73]|uniref:DUF2867 domain-containing protein n=1 Tax=Rhizobium sp. AB2/73 TaxID=2795216 RepID=UPI001C5FD6AF|nr:DUF2867 domain-containing protein [Rhizobium sp. AB2/73]QYA13186.1 DUF2867 domain-containing protein [Rhizobium sp. AB2/73]UEQ80881.1 DUF2867 domain-containing protein [Rhizobium sp. AB2/73]
MAGSLCTAVGGVKSVAPPAQSSIAGWYRGADLVDSFAPTFGAGISRDPEAVAHAILGRPAWWVHGFLATRDMTVARFGLKTTDELQRNARENESIAFFPVLSRSENELVLGVDDRHLGFRASILLGALNDEGAFEVVVTTVVHRHNTFGRAFLNLIRPFHVLVIRSSLRRAVPEKIGQVQRSSMRP